ncbi:hypothetical protein PICMEDRAFT_173614 [Pichia membranifaciens NRRL Y-2026]|uniref:Uncharacterized protein n=1 Tax=Pichia membranifaciens NRRL Y-2026 TaxID=763406 RepID=A0A1E3NEM5_9ASCO|nr:hypothetical protein PICMEDRAFT_173614 [Pichia membranifaciens NRRL Y-2026]ODQ44581.1 hypothetical protein PICMEDRAFT_173614 [Pichia membranifaciens NRRL Y-2026]
MAELHPGDPVRHPQPCSFPRPGSILVARWPTIRPALSCLTHPPHPLPPALSSHPLFARAFAANPAPLTGRQCFQGNGATSPHRLR